MTDKRKYMRKQAMTLESERRLRDMRERCIACKEKNQTKK
jgi:hypothetical protein